MKVVEFVDEGIKSIHVCNSLVGEKLKKKWDYENNLHEHVILMLRLWVMVGCRMCRGGAL